MKKKNNKSVRIQDFVFEKKAFTIIEILISLSIIIILSTLFLTNYKIGDKNSNLINFQTTLFNDLEKIKWKALNLENYNDQLPDYWGLHLNKASSSYDIFVDFGDSDETVKTQSIPSNLLISDINLSDEILVLFSTSTGFPIFYDVINSVFVSGDLILELKDFDFDFGKRIIINSHGLVDYDNCFCAVGYTNQCSWCN